MVYLSLGSGAAETEQESEAARGEGRGFFELKIEKTEKVDPQKGWGPG